MEVALLEVILFGCGFPMFTFERYIDLHNFEVKMGEKNANTGTCTS